MTNYNRGGTGARPQQQLNDHYQGGRNYNDGYNQNHMARDFDRNRGNNNRSTGNSFNGTFECLVSFVVEMIEMIIFYYI